MLPGSQRTIVINGIRYNVAIRLDTNWRYIAEWWNNSEYHKRTLDDIVRSTSKGERKAVDEIHKAHLRQEPWLYAEIASAERQDSCVEPGTP